VCTTYKGPIDSDIWGSPTWNSDCTYARNGNGCLRDDPPRPWAYGLHAVLWPSPKPNGSYIWGVLQEHFLVSGKKDFSWAPDTARGWQR
jgi:hypothetical protein